MIEYTKALARWASELKYEDIPDELIAKLKNHMLDTIGCAVAGSDKPEMLSMKSALMEETGGAAVWGTGKRVPAGCAMLINGAMSHTVELDDLHKPSKIHAGCVIIPPVMTAAEFMGKSGREILTAICAGYEVVIRMGMALGTDSHRRKGWHATATCGSFGAAAALCSLMGLDALQTANALGLAGTQTGGLMAYTADGSMSKRLHAGKAGENGWIAASLAAAGFTGPTYVLEASDGGYASAVSDKYNLDLLLEGLGSRYHAADTGLKFYACCGHIHQAIDGAVRLVRENGISAADVSAVRIRTYDVAGMAWGFNKVPENTVEAQFNIPYAVAVAMLDGKAFLPQFAPDRLGAEDVSALARRITVETDDAYTARYPQEWCSSVEITDGNGQTYFCEVCGAKGDPVNPLSYDEICEKFSSLAGDKLDAETKKKLVDYIENFEKHENLDDFIAMMKF